MHARVATLVLTLAFLQCASSFDSSNVVFVIISQTEPYHASVAARLKQNIENQVLEAENQHPIVHITHEDFRVPGAWTIIPLLRPLVDKYSGSDVRWVVFLEAHTAVRWRNLFNALAAADEQKDTMWIGYPLSDEEPTIIHHFTFYEDLEEEGGFVYPHFASGFAMRLELMENFRHEKKYVLSEDELTTIHHLKFYKDLEEGGFFYEHFTSGFGMRFELIENLLNHYEKSEWKLEADFSIDPAFELAQLVYRGADDPGPLLTPEMSFCVVSGDNCATYPRQFDTCGSAIPEESIYFAVKTWSGFHATRAKVVKRTWGKHVSNLMFYSDKPDPSLPAISTGVANSKTGHCMKTVAILKLALQKVASMPHVKWIFLADDDTILGVQRLCEVLSCYRGGSDVTVIGERYGYGHRKSGAANKGFDYITGGGGTVLSTGAAQSLSRCACAASSAPDDMTLGACALRHNVSVTHLPLFHQARPQDYSREVLARDRPVSFHGHSSPEPLRVYATWFQHDDLALKRRRVKDEL